MKKRILITGSTDGIGKLVATKLAKDGHRVYVHGRNSDKVATIISEIKLETSNEDVFGYVADFSDLASVKQMAAQIKNELPHIDVLINNAGVFKSPASSNEDGIDIRLVVNYLAQYLLTEELLPLLEKGTESRIVNLSSAAQSSISADALLGKAQIASVNEAYAQSKLALTMWSFHLAKELEDVSVIAVNPGSLLNTKMANEAYGQYWSPADKGSNILYELATSEKHKNSNGKYFDNDNGSFGTAHQDAYDESKIAQLLEITNRVLAKFY